MYELNQFEGPTINQYCNFCRYSGGSYPELEPNPVDIGGSSYTESTVYSGS